MPKALDKYYEKADKEVKTSNEKVENKEEPKALKKGLPPEEEVIAKEFKRKGLSEALVDLYNKVDGGKKNG